MTKKKINLLQIMLAFTLVLCSIATVCDLEPVHAKALDIKDGLELKFDVSQHTEYVVPDYIRTDETQVIHQTIPFVNFHMNSENYQKYTKYYGDNYTDRYMAALNDLQSSLKYESSDESILAFVEYNYGLDAEGNYGSNVIYHKTFQASKDRVFPSVEARKPGTVKLTVSSAKPKKKATLTIVVKDAEYTCDDTQFYAGNTYDFSLRSYDNYLKATRFVSSDPSIATVDESGKVTTKKKGKVSVTCTAENGKQYSQTLNIKEGGLNYKTLTTYYFTGMRKGYYSTFPLIAYGLDVKSWKSSNTKVIKVSKKGPNIGMLSIRGTGKSTITCTTKNGRKYTCKVTVKGGKTWSGLNNGYRPPFEEVKRSGWYKDLNAIRDYGNVVFYCIDYAKEIKYDNGNKFMKTWTEAEEIAEQILHERYPNKQVKMATSGDYVGFYVGKKYARIAIGCYYVE